MRDVDAFLLRQDVGRPDSLSGWSACEELCTVLVDIATRAGEMAVGSAYAPPVHVA
jgi:hypothetical protein